jgi:hypothetical protein
MDFMDSVIPLTPSYCTALLKYQKSVEPRLLEACAIKSRDTARQLQAIEKTRRKTVSGKHIQKNGVIYKGKGRAEAIEQSQEEREYYESVVNAKITRKVTATARGVQKILARARQEGNTVEKGETAQLELWQLVMYILDGRKEKIGVSL